MLPFVKNRMDTLNPNDNARTDTETYLMDSMAAPAWVEGLIPLHQRYWIGAFPALSLYYVTPLTKEDPKNNKVEWRYQGERLAWMVLQHFLWIRHHGGTTWIPLHDVIVGIGRVLEVEEMKAQVVVQHMLLHDPYDSILLRFMPVRLGDEEWSCALRSRRCTSWYSFGAMDEDEAGRMPFPTMSPYYGIRLSRGCEAAEESEQKMIAKLSEHLPQDKISVAADERMILAPQKQIYGTLEEEQFWASLCKKPPSFFFLS